MKKKTQLIIGMLVVSALIAGYAFCETGTCSSSQGKGWHGQKKEAIARELSLTPEQDKLLKDAKESNRAQMAELGKALKAKREELQGALAKSEATGTQVEPIAAEIKRLQSQMVDRKIDGILKVKEILTPEQFQKMQNKHEEWRKDGHMKHREKGR